MQVASQQRPLLQHARLHQGYNIQAVAAKALSIQRSHGRLVHGNQSSQESLGAGQDTRRGQLTTCTAFNLTAELFPAVAASKLA